MVEHKLALDGISPYHFKEHCAWKSLQLGAMAVAGFMKLSSIIVLAPPWDPEHNTQGGARGAREDSLVV